MGGEAGRYFLESVGIPSYQIVPLWKARVINMPFSAVDVLHNTHSGFDAFAELLSWLPIPTWDLMLVSELYQVLVAVMQTRSRPAAPVQAQVVQRR